MSYLGNPTRMLNAVFNLLQRIQLPSICALCNQFHKRKTAVCSFCVELIKPLGSCCRQCAQPLPQANTLCGLCIKKPPYFDRTFACYQFEEPLRSLIHHFKYHNGLYLSGFLSELMWQTLPNQASSAQCLIPVPMHAKRIKQRGFNQAAILAKILAKKLNLPCDLSHCKKIINTSAQANLDATQRKKNLHKAFLIKPLPYQHIIIIDDLMTTGSTANELAFSLKQSGIKQVDVWCCARAIFEPKKELVNHSK